MYAIIAKDEKELLEFAKTKGLKIVSLVEDSVSEETKEDNAIPAEKNIYQFFLSMGIKPHYDGFKYLVYIFENKLDCSKKITKDLYPAVAKHFNTTSGSVERAIRHAIESAVYDVDIMKKYIKMFGQFSDHPSNHQFLQGCAYSLKYSK